MLGLVRSLICSFSSRLLSSRATIARGKQKNLKNIFGRRVRHNMLDAADILSITGLVILVIALFYPLRRLFRKTLQPEPLQSEVYYAQFLMDNEHQIFLYFFVKSRRTGSAKVRFLLQPVRLFRSSLFCLSPPSKSAATGGSKAKRSQGRT